VSRELKVGLLTIISIGIFVVGYHFLKGSKVFKKEYTYYAKYDDVGGLMPSKPVFLNGRQIGRVADIQLIVENHTTHALVSFSVVKEMPLPKDSKFCVFSADLLGEKTVKVIYGKADQFAAEDDTLNGYVEASMLESLGTTVTPLIGHIDSLVVNINTLVDKNNKDNLQTIVYNLAVLSKDLPQIGTDVRFLLENQNSALNGTLNNLQSITANIKNDNKKIDNLLTNLSTFSDTLATTPIKQTVLEAKLALANINVLLDSVNHGNGTITELVKNPKLYNNLEDATKNINLLLTDVKANPSRYVHLSLWKVDRSSTPAEKKARRQKEKEEKARIKKGS